MYKFHRVGDRTEPCESPACIFRGADISPSTGNLKFLAERDELIKLILLAENCNWDNLCDA